MTKQEFRELAEKQNIYLDGATGSNLFLRGMPNGVCPEQWILENRQVLIKLQREYVEAGSKIIYAPTFSGNRIKLKEYGLEERIGDMNRQLVAFSKEAAAGRAYVAGDLTMTGQQLSPIGTLDFEELIEVYKEQIQYLVEGGADLLVVETMMSLQETRAALIAAKEVSDLPVIATMTFETSGRALLGTDARTAAVVLSSLGASAVGANCSTGPEQMAEIIKEMAAVTDLPIVAKPNAGMPVLKADGKVSYDMDAVTFGEQMKKLVSAGASILGGCCGTTPDYISSLVSQTSHLIPEPRKTGGKRYLASERKTLEFGLEDAFFVIGERINPTGKKKLQEELRQGKMDLIEQYAQEQENKGAAVLDINLGMSGINEMDLMKKTLELVTQLTSLPLCLDSSSVEVLEEALRRYPGRALLNSISLESAKCEALLHLAAKYGAMFILLPLSDSGLPKDQAEKRGIIQEIVKKAGNHDLTTKDIMVDGLVTTVGANPSAALEALETIRFCRENDLATTCGLSNISFGLPERGYVNSAFLTMAIQAGMTCAIANPSQELLMACACAADLLLGKEEAAGRYVSRFTDQLSPTDQGTIPKSDVQVSRDASKDVFDAVLNGRRGQIVAAVQEALKQEMNPQELLNNSLLPAIAKVGEFFDQGKYFLPQLIAGAEAMQHAIKYLEPMLKSGESSGEKPVVVIATVEGDIHDIGKNLVALMLKNHGYQVIDLGKDVPKEKIVEAARNNKAQVIALSALMTTTMQEMKRVIQYAKQQRLTAKIIIGGAVITQEYADEIGADGYSKDAADAVRLVKQIID